MNNEKFKQFEKPAFFYENGYYLLPEDCLNFDEFKDKYGTGKIFTATRLFERKCLAPYFVLENTEPQEVQLLGKFYSAKVFLMTQKQYNAFLRESVKNFCNGCPNFGEVTNDDASLQGHHEEINLETTCYFREIIESNYEYDLINFDCNIENFINSIASKLGKFEELIDLGKTRVVKNAISEELWQAFSIFEPKFFVGKKEYSSGYYFYFTSEFNQPLTLILKSAFSRLQEIGKEKNWDIKDYIPKGFFAKSAKKPKKINWRVVNFERNFYFLEFDEKDSANIDNYLLWFYASLGEDTFRSFIEGFDVVQNLAEQKKPEDFVKEIENYGESLPVGSISFPQAVVTVKNPESVSTLKICTALSTDLADFMENVISKNVSKENWMSLLYIGNLPLYQIKCEFETKIDFNNLQNMQENKDIDAIIKTSNYLKENYLGCIFSFELGQSSFEMSGFVFNIAKFKMALRYLSPLFCTYNAVATIYTKSGKNGGTFKISNELEKID